MLCKHSASSTSSWAVGGSYPNGAIHSESNQGRALFIVEAFLATKKNIGPRKQVPMTSRTWTRTGRMSGPKIGRWAGETLNSIRDDFFWGCLYLAHGSRCPLDHMHNWLQSSLSPGDPPKLATLVYSKASAIVESFDSLIDDGAYYHVWSDMLEVVEWRDEESWLARAVQVSLESSVDYQRRIVIPARKYPMLLAWFVKSPPGMPCEFRQRCSADLVSASDATVDCRTTVKLRFVFKKEIVDARTTGCLDKGLYDLLLKVVGSWNLNSQEVEGVNSVWKYASRLAPF